MEADGPPEVPATASVAQARALLARAGVRALPVAGPSGLVGVITTEVLGGDGGAPPDPAATVEATMDWHLVHVPRGADDETTLQAFEDAARRCLGGRRRPAPEEPPPSSGSDRVRVLEADECWRRLSEAAVGRLAIVQGSTPAIFPVNHAVVGRDIVFRTAPGSKLVHGPGHPAAFEVDHVSPRDRAGWSVVVVGHLEELAADDPLHERVRELVDPWAGPGREHVVRLVVGLVSGREVG